MRRLLVSLLLSVLFAPMCMAAKGSWDDKSIYPLMLSDGYISISVGGGISTMHYDVSMGERGTGGGGMFWVAENRFFSQYVGVMGGVGLSLNTANASLDGTDRTTIQIPSYTGTTYDCDYIVTYKGWTEKQTNIAADLPIGMLLRLPLFNKLTFLGNVGVILSFPFKTSYNVTSGKREIAGDVKDLQLHLEEMERHGFGTQEVNPDGKTETVTLSTSVFFELNFAHRVSNVNIYYGIFGNLGLNSITKNNMSLTTDGAAYNGVLRSTLCQDVKPAALGVKIGVMLPCPWMTATEVAQKEKESKERMQKKKEADKWLAEQRKIEEAMAQEAAAQGAQESTESTTEPKQTTDKPTTPNNANKKTPAKDAGKKNAKKPKKKRPKAQMYTGKKKPVVVRPVVKPAPKEEEQTNEYGVTESTKELFEKALNGIKFETGSTMIQVEYYEVLDAVVEVLRKNPDYKIVVKGHADNTGPRWSNNKHSRERASNVAEYLINKGIDESRVRTIGFGDTMPIETNDTEEGRSQNRRVEFELEY